MDEQRDAGARGVAVQDGATRLAYDGPKTAVPRLRIAGDEESRVVALYRTACAVRVAVDGRRRHRRARPHAVLRRIGRPGRRPRRAVASSRRRRCSRSTDTQKIQADVFGHLGELKTGALKVGDTVARSGRCRRARAHHPQPLGDAPDAQGAARSAGRARAAEGLAGRCRQDALRLRAQRADDRRRDRAASRRSSTARSSQNHATNARVMPIDDAVRRWRDDAVRREVRRRGARARHRHARASCAAARTSRAPATSACSRSSRRAASPPASAASRR